MLRFVTFFILLFPIMRRFLINKDIIGTHGNNVISGKRFQIGFIIGKEIIF